MLSKNSQRAYWGLPTTLYLCRSPMGCRALGAVTAGGVQDACPHAPWQRFYQFSSY